MTRPSAFFLTPEPPGLTFGGGGIRSASLLAYLRQKYDVDVACFTLPHNKRTPLARAARNSLRLIRGVPPLFDRFSGFEKQIASQMHGRYRVAVIEHFWCASYATLLRPHVDVLVLDLHNIESALARSHALATSSLEAIAFDRFAAAYEKLEREWLPRFDVVLVASDKDRARIEHPNVIVYPNALPEIDIPAVAEAECIVFSGNMEYHPNVEAVRWFHEQIWPAIGAQFPNLEWWLVGCNAQAIKKVLGGDSRIRVTGEVEDAIPLIAQAKAVIVPLLSGSGTRFKILEAWAAKRAVVSTTIGAEGLGAQHERDLLIANSTEAFTASLIRLLNDPQMRVNLGSAGHALYRSQFTWPRAWRKLEQSEF